MFILNPYRMSLPGDPVGEYPVEDLVGFYTGVVHAGAGFAPEGATGNSTVRHNTVIKGDGNGTYSAGQPIVIPASGVIIEAKIIIGSTSGIEIFYSPGVSSPNRLYLATDDGVICGGAGGHNTADIKGTTVFSAGDEVTCELIVTPSTFTLKVNGITEDSGSASGTPSMGATTELFAWSTGTYKSSHYVEYAKVYDHNGTLRQHLVPSPSPLSELVYDLITGEAFQPSGFLSSTDIIQVRETSRNIYANDAGYTISNGTSHYIDSSQTALIPAGEIIPALVPAGSFACGFDGSGDPLPLSAQAPLTEILWFKNLGCAEGDGSGWFLLNNPVEFTSGFKITFELEYAGYAEFTPIFGQQGVFHSYGYFYERDQFRIRDNNTGLATVIPLLEDLANGQHYKVEVIADGVDVELIINGVTQGSIACSLLDHSWDALFCVNKEYAQQRIWNIKVYDENNVLQHHWPCEDGHPDFHPSVIRLEDVKSGNHAVAKWFTNPSAFGRRAFGESYLANGFTYHVVGYLSEATDNPGFNYEGNSLEILPETADMLHNLPVNLIANSSALSAAAEWQAGSPVYAPLQEDTDHTRIGGLGMLLYSAALTAGEKAQADGYLGADPSEPVPSQHDYSTEAVGYWRMEGATEASGETDHSGSGADLTSTGTPQPSEWYGGSRYLDGSGEYFSVDPTGTDLDISGATAKLTIAARIKPTALGNSGSFHPIAARYKTSTNQRQYFFRVTSTTNRQDEYKLAFTVSGNGSTYTFVETTDTEMGLNREHTVFAVMDGTDIRIYVDGILACTPVAYTDGLMTGNIEDVHIGTWNDLTDHFDGFLNEVAIFDRALTEIEMLEITLQGVEGDVSSGNYPYEVIQEPVEGSLSVPNINSEIDTRLTANPAWTEVDMGVDSDSPTNDLRAVVIAPLGYTKTAVIVSGVHGNEEYAINCSLTLMDYLATEPSEYSSWRFVIVPCLNPSGRIIDDRKNDNEVSVRRVDLNRNNTSGWGDAGSTDPADPYYVGPSAASELETQALESLVSTYSPDLFIDVHDGAYFLSRQTSTPVTVSDLARERQILKGFIPTYDVVGGAIGLTRDMAVANGTTQSYTFEIGVFRGDNTLHEGVCRFMSSLQVFTDNN